MSAAKVKKFNTTLVQFLRTLGERCANDKDLSVEFHQAVNFVEVAASFDEGKPMEIFREFFLHDPLVHAVRRKNLRQALDILLEHSKQFEDAQGEGEAQGKAGAEDILAAFRILASHTELDEGVMPWKMLAELYEVGTDLDVATAVPERVYAFNALYEEFLNNMSVAFPPEDGKSVVPKFHTATLWRPESVIEQFKVHAMPHFQGVAQGAQVNDDVYASPNTVFAHLPYVNELPLEHYWTLQVTQNAENKKYIAETFVQLVMSTMGLPAKLFSSSVLGDVHRTVLEKLEQSDVDGDAPVDPADNSKIFSIAMDIMQSMQDSGQLDAIMGSLGNVSSLDIDTELLSSLSDNLQLPEELQLMLDAAAIDQQPIAASLQAPKK